MASITAARRGKSVLLLEKLSTLGAKLKATGGGRCNLTNTLDNEEFMDRFGRNGRFMRNALELFDHKALIDFFNKLDVKTDALDGFRVFPATHNSQTVLNALLSEARRVGVTFHHSTKVDFIEYKECFYINSTFKSRNLLIATGGRGYSTLGGGEDGYKLAKSFNHTVTDTYPAMLPLKTKEKWVANCTADTIPKVEIRVGLKKHKKLKARGDLIFTKDGIKGPVVLDFATQLTPLISKYQEVPLLLNFTKGMSESDLIDFLKKTRGSLEESLKSILPDSLLKELCKLANVNPKERYSKLKGEAKEKFVKILAWTPLSVVDSYGFEKAMVTKGGVSLKEVEPNTLQSKIQKNLYFAGEVLDIDGPCGGFNLQWAFSSGFLVGHTFDIE